MIKKLPEDHGMQSLAVPFSLLIFKKCIRYRIDTQLIKHLHLFDLQCLLIQFETQDIIQYLKEKEKEQMRLNGIKEIKDINGSEAIKFLGR